MSAACSKKDSTWTAIFVGLPPSNSSNLSLSTSTSYLLYQTHEPLMRLRDNGIFYSNILKSWNRSLDSKEYQLCIQPGLSFIEGKNLSTKHIVESLESLKNDLNLSISSDEECVKISSPQSSPLLLDKLKSYEYAPQIDSEYKKWKIGLGPYKIKNSNEDQINLEIKNENGQAFDKIQIITLSAFSKMKTVNYTEIEDYNRIPYEQIPLEVKNTYKKYPAPLLKTHGLLLNIPDSRTRKSIANCLDLKGLKNAFFPNLENEMNIASIIPIGIDGAIEGSIARKCDIDKKKKKRQLVFANWNHSRSKEIKAFFELQNKSNGTNIISKDLDQNDLIGSLYGNHEAYDLLILGVDTNNEEYGPFFEPFLGTKKKVHRIPIEKQGNILSTLATATSKEDAKKIAVSIDAFLRSEGIFLPVAQDFRTFLFPHYIKNFNIGKNFLGNIEIGSLRP